MRLSFLVFSGAFPSTCHRQGSVLICKEVVPDAHKQNDANQDRYPNEEKYARPSGLGVFGFFGFVHRFTLSCSSSCNKSSSPTPCAVHSSLAHLPYVMLPFAIHSRSAVWFVQFGPTPRTRPTLAKPARWHDHNVMDSRRATHVPPFLPGQRPYDLKPGINSQFLGQYQLSRNRFLLIK